MSASPTNKRRSQCPCAPPAGLSSIQLDMFYDACVRLDNDSLRTEIMRSYPSGPTAVLYHGVYLHRPKSEVDSSKEVSFDETVERAHGLLFGTEVPDSESKLRKDHSPLDAWAERLFYLYQQGWRLQCPVLTDYANRSDEKAWIGQRVLRTLLGLFDQNGEPIPKELRKWSAQSRLENPKRKRGRPREYWFRNHWIVRAVAALVYETGRNPTRNAEPKKLNAESACDAVVAAFKKEGLELPLDTAQSAWTRKKKGSKLLERWRQASN